MPKVNWVNVYSLIAARLLMSMEKNTLFLGYHYSNDCETNVIVLDACDFCFSSSCTAQWHVVHSFLFVCLF